MADIKKKDLYLLLGVEENATAQQVRKAYRKKALQYHPDKNPDDKKAADLFHELSEALKILTDLGARAAYDHARAARKSAAARTAKWDESRKRAKLDLDKREKAAENIESKAEHNLETEIQRLRDEGSRILQEEIEAVKKQFRTEVRPTAFTVRPATLKVKWKLAGNDNLYNEKLLREMFSKHGSVTGVVAGSKKKHGTAIIEFADARHAKFAHDTEIGFPQCPLHVSWLSGPPPDIVNIAKSVRDTAHVKSGHVPEEINSPSGTNVDEFEALVFAKMRQKKAKNANPDFSNDASQTAQDNSDVDELEKSVLSKMKRKGGSET